MLWCLTNTKERILIFVFFKSEVQNSRVTKSSYESELHKMTSHFKLLTQTFIEILTLNY